VASLLPINTTDGEHNRRILPGRNLLLVGARRQARSIECRLNFVLAFSIPIQTTTGRTSGVSLRLDQFTSPVAPLQARRAMSHFRSTHRFPGVWTVATASR
jgi:hypothetical protein